ncbi:MAG TPA: MFS transporter [Solirubrobacteraceae bacterium]|nr:MFS transporter [Solirubrobacteraceae bacterium]
MLRPVERSGGGAEPLVRRRAPPLAGVLAVTSLCVAMAFIDATVVNIAFPSIARSFPASPVSTVSWVLNAYNIVFAALLVAAGRIGDVFGRRRLLSAGVVIFVVGSALCAAASSVPELVAFRAVQAVGGAMLVPCALAVVLEAAPVERRAHAVAVFSAISALAAGLGPTVGGALVSLSSWRLVFLVNLPIGVVAVALVRTVLVESRAPGRRRLPDLGGALLLAVAVAALVLAIVQGQAWGWGSLRIIAAWLVALGTAAWFAWRSGHHPTPVLDLSIIGVRAVGVADGATVVAAAGFYGYTLVNVLFLTGVWHYSILDAGLGITPGPFVALIVAAPANRLAERVGARAVLVLGGLLWAGGVYWFVARTGLHPAYASRWLPGMMLAGVGAGIFFPNVSSVAVSEASDGRFATATSLNAVARQVGAALGVAAVVAILGRPSPAEALAAFHHAWWFGVAALAGAAAAALAIGRPNVARAERPTTQGERRAATVTIAPLRPTPASAAARAAAAARIAAGSPGASTLERPQTMADFLGRVPMFAGLGPAIWDQLAGAATGLHLEAGEWLFHEGEEGDALYIVTAGRLEVIAQRGAGPVLSVIGRGGVIGEYALLTSEPRSASARAARAADLIAIERAHFDALLLTHPEVARTLVREFATTLRGVRSARIRARALPTTVALVALDERIPLRELTEGLRRAVARHASAAVLTAPAEPLDPSAAPSRYGPLLDRAAEVSDLVLLPIASPWGGDAWSAFCLQQADRILAIGSGVGGRDPEPVAHLRGCDLVAWDVPAGARRVNGWARELAPRETHSWRSGAELERDLARTARRLTGHAVGIVLGGGGARAFAHIGVLEELAAAGVVIDRVGAVSMGSFIGALLAAGRSPEEIDAICYEEWVRRHPLGDYTLPRHALLRGQRGEAMVRRVFGTQAIPELPLSFFALAADLRTGERIVYRHGSLYDAVSASIALPVLIPPRVVDGELVVDGAMVDNLPVGPMAELAEGPIIAVDIRAGLSERPSAASGAQRLPPLAETLMRVMFLGNKLGADDALADVALLLRPRHDGIGLLEFHQIDRAREAGRRAVREALEQLEDAA